LAEASILAIPSSFNSPVTTTESLDLESTASAKRVVAICRSVWSCVHDSMFGVWCDPTSPGEARSSFACAGGYAQNLGRASGIAIPSSFASSVTTTASLPFLGVPTYHPPTSDAKGYAENLAGASILAIPSSFDSPVTTTASLDLESIVSAKAKSLAIPSSFDSPATATASLDLFGVHTNQPPTRNAGGPAKISEGASTLAIQPSFVSPASSGTNMDLDSTARAPTPSPRALEHFPSAAPLAAFSLSLVPADCHLLDSTASVASKVFEAVSRPWFAQGHPLGVHTNHAPTREAGGHAKILAAVSILAIPSSFARSVTSEASLDLDSTASATAKSPERSEHPTATNASAVATLLSVLPACFPASEVAAGITTAAHQVLDVPSGQWLAPGCSLGPFQHAPRSCVAGGPAKILLGATTLAIQPSFDGPVPSGANKDPDSTARAPVPLISAFKRPPLPAPPATFSLPPASTVCHPMRGLFGGTASVPSKVFEVVPSPRSAQECPLGVHTHHDLTREARGHAEISAGASILAIPSSIDCPRTPGTPTMSPLRLRSSRLPNSCSTALSPLPVPNS